MEKSRATEPALPDSLTSSHINLRKTIYLVILQNPIKNFDLIYVISGRQVFNSASVMVHEKTKLSAPSKGESKTIC
jgi:hypothetical protein